MAGGAGTLVQDIGACLVGAGVLAVAFERVRLPHVAAFLAAGVALGPVGLSVVTDAGNIQTIAHLGLTLLLFLIGLEINLKGLLASGRALLLGGLLQVPLSVAVAFGVFTALAATGLAGLGGSWVPLYLALTCAFSSTLLVVKLLQERLRLDTVAGRTSVGLLIFQDIWAIVVLAIQPSFSKPDLTPILLTFAGIAVLALVAVLCARVLLPAAFRLVSRLPELLVMAALAWCFGLALLGANLGGLLSLLGLDVPISVSMEMGALIAGTSIATFPHAHDVVAKIANLRDFFVTLFFVALGMAIPLPDGPMVPLLALVIAAVTLAVRGLVFVPLLHAGGLDRRHALETSVQLAQVSEFCLVIAFLGEGLGHVPRDVVSAITLAFVATAVATPFLFSQAAGIERGLGPLLERLGLRRRTTEDHGEGHGKAPRLILLGFHRVASSLLHDLQVRHPDLMADTLVVDFNVTLHDAIRRTGARVAYGDLAQPETLRHAGVAEAEVIVSTIPDELLKGTSNLALTRQLRALAPNATLVMSATRVADAKVLREAGASWVHSWRVDAAAALLPAIDAALNGTLPDTIEARRVSQGSLEDRTEVLD